MHATGHPGSTIGPAWFDTRSDVCLLAEDEADRLGFETEPGDINIEFADGEASNTQTSKQPRKIKGGLHITLNEEDALTRLNVTVPCYVLKTKSPYKLLLGHTFAHEAGAYVDPVTSLMTYRPYLAQHDTTTTGTLTMRTHTATPTMQVNTLTAHKQYHCMTNTQHTDPHTPPNRYSRPTPTPATEEAATKELVEPANTVSKAQGTYQVAPMLHYIPPMHDCNYNIVKHFNIHPQHRPDQTPPPPCTGPIVPYRKTGRIIRGGIYWSVSKDGTALLNHPVDNPRQQSRMHWPAHQHPPQQPWPQGYDRNQGCPAHGCGSSTHGPRTGQGASSLTPTSRPSPSTSPSTKTSSTWASPSTWRHRPHPTTTQAAAAASGTGGRRHGSPHAAARRRRR